MQIQISTDNNLTAHESRTSEITEVVTHALRHFSDHITRVEVHLADENGPKRGANDIRCSMEARIEGRQPMGVTHHANTVALAVRGAADSLNTVISTTLDRAKTLRRSAGAARPAETADAADEADAAEEPV